MPESTDKLDQIIAILDKMNRRDRLRTIGGAIRSIIAIIPIVLLLWSAWYFSQHGTELLKQLSDQAVKSAAGYNQQSIMDQAKQYIQQMKK